MSESAPPVTMLSITGALTKEASEPVSMRAEVTSELVAVGPWCTFGSITVMVRR